MNPAAPVPSSPLVLYGAGGHGRVVLEALRSTGVDPDWVVDDQPEQAQFDGFQVRFWASLRAELATGFRFTIAVGANEVRARLFRQLLGEGGVPTTVVHRAAVVSPAARIGAGTLVCAGAVVNPGASLGMSCIVNTSASVDHDCTIQDDVHLCPGVRLGGEVFIGAGSMLGLGAVVLPGIKVGAHVVVGAGAVVNRDLPDNVVAFGVPARVVRGQPAAVVSL